MKKVCLVLSLLYCSTFLFSEEIASNVPTLQTVLLNKIIAQIGMYQNALDTLVASIVLDHLSDQLERSAAITKGAFIQFAELVAAHKLQERYPWIQQRIQKQLTTPFKPLENNIPHSGVKARAQAHKLIVTMPFNTRRAIEQAL